MAFLKCLFFCISAIHSDKRVKLLQSCHWHIPHAVMFMFAGGYFMETYRSGSIPMSTNGETDENGSVFPSNRVGSVRNAMTSMLFVATSEAPMLYFGVNKSDHVHFYQGGCSYTYIVVHPDGRVEQMILGGKVEEGEKLQIVFPSGCFKAGHLNGSHCFIGEAVAPGFDFRDFEFCDENMLEERLKIKSDLNYLRKYVKPDRRRNFDDYYVAHSS